MRLDAGLGDARRTRRYLGVADRRDQQAKGAFTGLVAGAQRIAQVGFELLSECHVQDRASGGEAAGCLGWCLSGGLAALAALRGCLLLAPDAGLLVVLATAGLGENTVLLHALREAL